MPLPLDLPGRPEERVARQLAEAMLFESLVDAEVVEQGTRRLFGWSHGRRLYRCAGTVGAFGRVRLQAGSIATSHDGAWRQPALAELVDCLPGRLEHRQRLLAELESTLDHCRWNEANLSPASRRDMPFAALDAALHEGHAYHPCFKARTGFSPADHGRYGPEAGNGFRLVWLAVARREVQQRLPADEATFWTGELGGPSFETLRRRMADLGLDWQAFALVPLHPWQWTTLEHTLLAPWLADGTARHLGRAGDCYVASQSVRTLFNADRPERASVKLAMNITNSSSLRTLEPHSVCTAPVLSRWLSGIVAGDPLFRTRYPLAVLDEYAGIIAGRDGPLAGQLAAIWRGSVSAVLRPGEAAVPFNALMLTEHDGRPFVDAWIGRHGLEAWLAQLLQVAVLPVWHLLVGHGIATEAHGQNMVLVHRDGWPVRLVLRDFHDSLEYVPGFVSDPEGVPDFLALDPAYRTAEPDRFYWMEAVESLGELVMDALFVFNLAEIAHLLHVGYGLREEAFWVSVDRLLGAYAAERDLAGRQSRLGLAAPRIAVESLLARKLAIGRTSHLVPNPLRV